MIQLRWFNYRINEELQKLKVPAVLESYDEISEIIVSWFSQ